MTKTLADFNHFATLTFWALTIMNFYIFLLSFKPIVWIIQYVPKLNRTHWTFTFCLDIELLCYFYQHHWLACLLFKQHRKFDDYIFNKLCWILRLKNAIFYIHHRISAEGLKVGCPNTDITEVIWIAFVLHKVSNKNFNYNFLTNGYT